eukprot:TRINITY_DN854_c0_g1_i1.p1 TRINITY_DN854_c0_g1~~TRINITY_DN854_c0_g1_i1.p1  ORF type:complete len:814 (-),score=271.86 TRINITY_DN854_c0_g1_i1:61-2430(-)
MSADPTKQFLASRLSRLGTETAFDVLARAKAMEKTGKTVVHFEIGEPDFDTPANIIEAAVTALKTGKTHYTPAQGMVEFREVICQHMKKTRNFDCVPEEIVVTPGAKPIMFFTMLACINEGDEVIYPNPGFPIYESMINFVGAKAVPLPLYESRKFRFDPEELRSLITPKTKMIITNSPHNPTGGILTRAELDVLAEISEKHNILVLSDEIYDDVIYESKLESLASYPSMKPRLIILAGHSKNYAMTGWRLGYGIFPKQIAAMIAKLAVNSVSCTAQFTQVAGMEALAGPQDSVKKMVAEWKRRRDYMVRRLNEMGLTCLTPEGAFYVFPSVKGLNVSSKALADYFLENGIAVLDGACFGAHGNGYIRLSYATSMQIIEKGLDMMEQALKKVKSGQVKLPGPTVMPRACAAPKNWTVHNPDGKIRVVVTKNMPGTQWLQLLTEEGCRVEVGTSDDILSKDEIKQVIGKNCQAVIGQLTEKWDKELFSCLKQAGGKVYSNMAVGFDNIDIPAATSLGIFVGNTPGVLTETTAEMAIALTFAAARRVVEADLYTRTGKFKGFLPTLFVGKRLLRGTLGIVGAGRIGANYAIQMATAQKMNVLYYDVVPNPKMENYLAKYSEFLKSQGEAPIKCQRIESLDDLFRISDVVSLHTNLTSETRHMVNASRLSMMKDTAILVNTARGPCIDEKALIDHCRTHPNFAAALDVFEFEPRISQELAQQLNIVMVPHISSATEYTRSGMATLAAKNIVAMLTGQTPIEGENYEQLLQDSAPKKAASILNWKDLKPHAKL